MQRALQVQPAVQGRSTEADVCDIQETTVCPPDRLRMDIASAELGPRAGLSAEELAAIESPKDKMPAEPVPFE